MINYSKYDKIQTEEIIHEVNHYYGNLYEKDLNIAVKQRQSDVNSAISTILSNGHEIIDVRYDYIPAVNGNNDTIIHTIIIYGKRNIVKK